MYLVHASDREIGELVRSLVELKKKTCLCSVCFNLSDSDVCPICADRSRDQTLVCVVEGPAEVMAIEQTGAFKGLYHVLHGVISPMDGIGPEHIKVRELLDRIGNGKVEEVVIATGTRVEGEATASYLAGELKRYNVRVTRLASGMPCGGEVKYIDPVTLKTAVEKRHAI